MWYSFLPKLLNMSITGSIMILLVLLLRLALRRAPKVFSYALWAVVLFRLLCPFSVSSPTSVLNVAATPEVTAGRVEYIPASVVFVDTPVQSPAEVPAPSGGSVSILPWIWLIGAVSLLVYSAVQFLLLRRRLVGAICLRDNIYLADHIDTPFVTGLFRPRIYLPSALSEPETRYILLHEQHHIRRLDHITRILAFGTLCLHWFNPLVWVAFVLSGVDMEMSCDEAVLKKMGTDIRQDYSRSLLSLATGRRIIAGTPLAFGEGNTKSRIKNVLRYRKPAFWVAVAAVLACIIAGVCLLTNPVEAEKTTPLEPVILQETPTEPSLPETEPTQPETEPSQPETEPTQPTAPLPVKPSTVLDQVFSQGSAIFTQNLSNDGQTRSFQIKSAYTELFRNRMMGYIWTEQDTPGTYSSEYWLTLSSVDGTKALTFWDDGAAGTVQYTADGTSLYWSATAKDANYTSVVSDIRREYLEFEALPDSITLQADSPEDAAAEFASRAYAEHRRSLTSGSPYRVLDYQVIRWQIEEVNEARTALWGEFQFAIVPEDENMALAGGSVEIGTGKYEGMYITSLEFALQQQEDGLWHCMGTATGGMHLPE